VAARVLKLRRPDTCRECGSPLAAGVEAWWDQAARAVTCTRCRAAADAPPIARGEAGASAAREHERRKAAREKRTREAHPLIGGALFALRSAPQHETAFDRGAAGERAVAARLDDKLGDGQAIVLHDRRMPQGRGNIDHLVIAPAGVFVVDAKDLRGKVRVAKPLLGSPKLLVAGRDRTKLIDGIDRQVTAVRDALPASEVEVPVRGILCFTRAELPMLGTLRMRGHELLYRKALVKRLSARGDLDETSITTLATVLAAAFPPA
jgi:hypothetical protein